MMYRFKYMKALGQGMIEHRKLDGVQKNFFQIEMKAKFKWCISKPLQSGQSELRKKFMALDLVSRNKNMASNCMTINDSIQCS